MLTDASSLHLMQELRTVQGYDGWTVEDDAAEALAVQIHGRRDLLGVAAQECGERLLERGADKGDKLGIRRASTVHDRQCVSNAAENAGPRVGERAIEVEQDVHRRCRAVCYPRRLPAVRIQ